MESPAGDVLPSPPEPGRQRKRKIFLRAGVVLLSLLIAAILLAPTMLSTDTGKGFIEEIASDRLPGALKIGSLSLGWFGGQRIQDVQFRDSDGNTFRLEEASTELSLWNALVGNYDLGKTRLRNLDVRIVVGDAAARETTPAATEEQERVGTATSRATPPSAVSFEKLLPRSLILDAEVTAAKITVTTPQRPPVVIDDLKLSLNRTAPGGPLAFGLSGRSRQGSLAGSFGGKGVLHGLSGGEGGPARAQVQIAVKDLPTDGIDGLFGLRGVLSAGLGPMINVDVETRATSESQDLRLRIDCAQLNARLAGRAEGDTFALTETGQMSAKLAPGLLAKLSTAKDLQLSAPLPMQVTIGRLAFPLRGFDPSKVAMTAHLEAGGGAKLGDLDLRSLTASLVSDSLAKSVVVGVAGDLAEGREATTVRINGELSDLLNTRGRPQLDRMRLEGKVAIDGLSMSLVDRLLGQDALAQELLGPRVGLRCTSSFAGSQHGSLKLDLQAPKVHLGTVELEVTDRLSLKHPVVLRTTLSKELLARFVTSDLSLELRHAVPIELTLGSFSAPRPQRGEPVFQPDSTTLDATLRGGPLKLGGVQRLGDFTATSATASIRGEPVSSLEVRSSLEIYQPEPGGALRELTGSTPLKIAVRASGGFGNQGIKATDVQLGLESDRLAGRILARVDKELTAVSLREPAKLRLVLVPALLHELGLARSGAPSLAGPTTLLVAVERAHVPLGDSPSSLEFRGSSSLDRVTLGGEPSWSGAALHHTKISFGFHGADGSGTANVESKASLPGQDAPGSLSVDARLSGLWQEKGKAALDATVRLDGLPTAFVEALASQGNKLAVIGPMLRVHATAHLAGLEKPTGAVDARVESQNLMVDAGLNITEKIQLSRPVKARLTLTPESYERLTAAGAKKSMFVLGEPATIEATIESLRWPRATDLPRAVNGGVQLKRMRFLNRNNDRIVDLEGVTATAQSTDLAKSLQVKIAGSLGGTGRIGVSLALDGLLTAAGQLTLEGLSTGLNAELRDLPVAALDGWLGLDGLLLAALGKQLTVTATSTLQKMNGPLRARLQANQARGVLDCSLRDKAIQLNSPLVVELEATPELGRRLLSRLHPFLRGIATGTAIKLTVDKEGVLVPLEDFDIGRLVVPEMAVDLGKTTLEADVVLEALLALAKRKNPGRLNAWFTPAVFTVRNGTVRFTKRMDVLFDKDFHVATWGSADLRSAAYRQTVAMTGPTLAKIFHLKNIGPEEMFRIPIRGVANAPTIDYAKAAADLGRLRAEDEALSKLSRQLDKLPPFLRGTVEAQVKKAARQLAGSLGGGDQSPPPPPSARPLPWK